MMENLQNNIQDILSFLLSYGLDTTKLLIVAFCMLSLIEIVLRLLPFERSMSMLRMVPKLIYRFAKLSDRIARLLDKLISDRLPGGNKRGRL